MKVSITPPLRGRDPHGAGYYGAPRGGRTHGGIDFACYKGSVVHSVCDGEVTKIGYPYAPSHSKKGHLRYVQITADTGHDVRYFYTLPLDVKIGDYVREGEPIATTQGLTDVYEGIIDHFHFEVKYGGKRINPNDYLEDL